MVLFMVMFIFGLSFLGLTIYMIFVYNGLVMLSRNIDKSWSNIDVLLKQRHDEIPKLIKLCEGYMRHEREIFKEITSARRSCMSAATVDVLSKTESQLSVLEEKLFAMVENYPDLKSDAHFIQLQKRISDLESRIADRRVLFNESVNNYNIRITQIPDKFFARLLGYNHKYLFKIWKDDREDVDIRVEFAKG